MLMAKHTAGQTYASTESFLRLPWYAAQGFPEAKMVFLCLMSPNIFFLQVCLDAF